MQSFGRVYVNRNCHMVLEQRYGGSVGLEFGFVGVTNPSHCDTKDDIIGSLV
jgi:hypothetical protein